MFEKWATTNIHILYMVVGLVGGIGIGILMFLLMFGIPVEGCS
jgi:hypothetical protein